MYDFTAKLKKNLSNNVSVEEIFFIYMDGVSGLADGAKSIFPNVIVQRCIRTFNTEFYQVHTIERLQSIYRQS